METEAATEAKQAHFDARAATMAGMTIAQLDTRRIEIEHQIAALTELRNELVAAMRERMKPLRARKV